MTEITKEMDCEWENGQISAPLNSKQVQILYTTAPSLNNIWFYESYSLNLDADILGDTAGWLWPEEIFISF